MPNHRNNNDFVGGPMIKKTGQADAAVSNPGVAKSPISRSVRLALLVALGVGATGAPAQQNAQNPTARGANQESSDLDEVVVTGSRLVVDGTQAPTPVTVVSTEQMQLAAPRTMTEALLQLPVFAGSVSVANQSTGTTSSNGAAHLNLRGLGTSRTLVLLDGRRVVPATNIGSVDVALLPEALVQRVEVVTGGASAAYGSEAVSGVVNFVLDTKFEGVKASLQGAISQQSDNEGGKFMVAAGKSFMNDRLHAIGSVEYYTSAGVPTANARDWAYGGTGYINNPAVTAANPASATNPIRLLVNNPLTSIASFGGLITNTALAGTTFDIGGVPRAFQYGAFRTAATMAGSSDPTAYNPNLELTLQPEQKRTSAFFHVNYEVSDALELYAEGNYSQNDIYYNSLPTFELSQTAFTIFPDNAYLPASIRSQMVAGNITSATLGRVSPDIAIPTMDATSKTTRLVLGFDGKFGESWSYKGYYQYGRNASLFQTLFDPISERLYAAADAVVNPANGQIVCRTTLTNPSDGCVPMNIFGRGSPSAASIAWSTGTAVQDVVVRQDVVEASVQGKAMDLPAGPLGVAIGAGYRKESFVQVVDPISSKIRTGAGVRGFPTSLVNTLGGFERTNPQPSKGDLDVTEAFAEVNVPVLADAQLAKQLTANGAVRYSDYSTSGGITSWKLGVVYEPVAGVRFRATQSADIRAPSLGELYRGSSQGTATITDPSRNNEIRNALTGNIGNTELTPEKADTTVFGVVLQPESIPRLSMSVDYYTIKIKDALSALAAQRTVDLCYQGATSLCRFVQRDSLGRVSRVELPFFNVDLRSTRGVDMEVSYQADLGASTLGLRLIANHLLSFETQVAGAAPIELAGDIGSNSTPKWTGVLSADLKFGDWSVYLQERYIGSGKFDNTYTERDADKNFQAAYYYTDATVNYSFGAEKQYRWFFTVNNLFDKDPPLTPGILISGANYGNRTLYDMIGRMYTTGVRVRF
jgi:iron complex outermembrane receptor protein